MSKELKNEKTKL